MLLSSFAKHLKEKMNYKIQIFKCQIVGWNAYAFINMYARARTITYDCTFNFPQKKTNTAHSYSTFLFQLPFGQLESKFYFKISE